MFVLTEDCEILNLAQCIKIVVRGKEINTYAPANDAQGRAYLIARFDTEVEAGYACFELFKALKAGEKTWNPDTLKPLSTVWEEIGKHFNNSNVPKGLTLRSHISAFRLDKVTITYDSQMNGLLGKESIAEHQKKIAEKLRELLGDLDIEVEWTS